MGRSPRPKPKRLGEKLLAIRQGLGMSQTQMCKALGLKVNYSAISNYELGTREPPLPVLLEYARAANVYVDALINDSVKLPDLLPSKKKSEGIARASSNKQNA
jgi:transcriptional regulator with XRE-family HTH domain